MKINNVGYKVTILILIVAIIWLLIDKYQSQKANKELVAKIEQTIVQKDSIRNELKDLYDTYNSLQTDNEQLNDSLSRQKQRIEKLMVELKKTRNIDAARIKDLKKEVATLKKIMKSYIRQIDSLYQRNQVLIVENKTIKKKYQNVVEEKEQLVQKKDSLENTVRLAKSLTAYNVDFKALNRRDKPTIRARKARRFEVCFLLSENKVVTKGYKDVYIRIAKPGGEILRNDDSGFFKYQDKEIAYSSVRKINYTGEAQEICVYFNIKEDQIPKGNYTVFIFVGNKEIGDKVINLK